MRVDVYGCELMGVGCWLSRGVGSEEEEERGSNVSL